MARPRKYKTKAEFEAAVNRYFDSISRMVPLMEAVPAVDEDGKILLTNKGHTVYVQRQVLNMAGEPLQQLEYVMPPTILGICNALSISRDTWSSYGRRKGFSDVVTRARARIEQYLEEQLIANPRATQGIRLNLCSNYGWSDKRVVEVGEDTRDVMAKQPELSATEKMAFVLQVLGPAALSEDDVEQVEADSKRSGRPE